MKIIPAILAPDLIAFEEQLAALSFAPEIQIDIMDGVFVESTSVQLSDIEELPDDRQFEVHLMVADPLRYLSDCDRLGISRVALHAEIEWDIAGVVRKFQEAGIEVIVALNPASNLEVLHGVLGVADGVLIMSVVPGRGGQDFIPEVLSKVAELKKQHPDLYVEMDGGIGEATIVQVQEAGVDAVAVGSRIIGSDNPQMAYEKMVQLAV